MTTQGNEMRAVVALMLHAFSSLGCDQLEAIDLHNLGNTEAPETENSASARLAPVPIASETYSDFVGTWVGVAEDVFGAPDANGQFPVYHFPSGSSEIRLVLQPPGADGTVPSGSALTFGSGGPYPPATDPLAPYPADPQFLEQATLGIDSYPPLEGFQYSVSQDYHPIDVLNLVRRTSDPLARSWVASFPEEEVYGNRLDLIMHQGDVFDSWCRLQTRESCDYAPLQMSDTGSGLVCEETSAQYMACGDLFPRLDDAYDACIEEALKVPFPQVDCTHASICEKCSCTEAGCRSYLTNPFGLRLQPMSDGSLIGVFEDLPVLDASGYRTELGTVRFTRVAP